MNDLNDDPGIVEHPNEITFRTGFRMLPGDKGTVRVGDEVYRFTVIDEPTPNSFTMQLAKEEPDVRP